MLASAARDDFLTSKHIAYIGRGTIGHRCLGLGFGGQLMSDMLARTWRCCATARARRLSSLFEEIRQRRRALAEENQLRRCHVAAAAACYCTAIFAAFSPLLPTKCSHTARIASYDDNIRRHCTRASPTATKLLEIIRRIHIIAGDSRCA